ncbi:MAG: hypothetical protein Q7T55_19450, partial [Solirubrobacteraceae bacterium]|nr:hypothetical protein [Solirubrobacteraceae bacterium]
MSGDEPPQDATGPDLRKPEPSSTPQAPQAPQSIWQPLDGSAPPKPPLNAAQQAWARPHAGGTPAPP